MGRGGSQEDGAALQMSGPEWKELSRITTEPHLQDKWIKISWETDVS